MSRALLASVLASAALAAAPAAALAQDAGGGQYTDPLGNGNGHHSTPTPPSPPSNPATASASSASPGSTAAASTSSSATASAQAGKTIPRTGFPVGLLMFAGALFLSGGLSLRRLAGTTGA